MRVNGNPGLRVTAVIAGEFGNTPTGAPTGKKKAPRVAGLFLIRGTELLCSASLADFGGGVFPAEALDASGGVDQLLLACEKRMALGADLNVDVSLVGRTGYEVRAAGAHDANLAIFWVNSLFWHDEKPFLTEPLVYSKNKTSGR